MGISVSSKGGKKGVVFKKCKGKKKEKKSKGFQILGTKPDRFLFVLEAGRVPCLFYSLVILNSSHGYSLAIKNVTPG